MGAVGSPATNPKELARNPPPNVGSRGAESSCTVALRGLYPMTLAIQEALRKPDDEI